MSDWILSFIRVEYELTREERVGLPALIRTNTLSSGSVLKFSRGLKEKKEKKKNPQKWARSQSRATPRGGARSSHQQWRLLRLLRLLRALKPPLPHPLAIEATSEGSPISPPLSSSSPSSSSSSPSSSSAYHGGGVIPLPLDSTPSMSSMSSRTIPAPSPR